MRLGHPRTEAPVTVRPTLGIVREVVGPVAPGPVPELVGHVGCRTTLGSDNLPGVLHAPFEGHRVEEWLVSKLPALQHRLQGDGRALESHEIRMRHPRKGDQQLGLSHVRRRERDRESALGIGLKGGVACPGRKIVVGSPGQGAGDHNRGAGYRLASPQFDHATGK